MLARLFLSLALALAAGSAAAFPDMVRAGYPSCTTCHVSPSGGGALTPYGRGVAGERLVTWHTEKEDLKLPDWLILGADVRQIQTHYESKRTKDGRWFTMQRDAEVGLTKGPFTAAVTAGLDSGPALEEKWRTISRRHFLRLDAAEGVTLRVGRFYPRFGLMLPDHETNVRRDLAFGPGRESDNAELTLTTETQELTATVIGGRRWGGDRKDPGQPGKGGALAWSLFPGERHRVGLSCLSDASNTDRRLACGANAALTFGDWWWLGEFDQIRRVVKATGVHERDLVGFQRLAFEPFRGVTPFVQSETTITALGAANAQRADSRGFGAQWYPRVHLELSAMYAYVLLPGTFDYANAAYFMLHFYL